MGELQRALVFSLYCLFISTVRSYVPPGQTHPPSITRQSDDQLIIFKKGLSRQIVCVASGNPEPTYEWTKNGRPFNPEANTDVDQERGLGTLTFSDPVSEDQGVYQCRAINEYGTALTQKVTLLEAVMDPFPGNPVVTPKQVRPTVGQSLKLPCDSPRSIPASDVVWNIRKDRVPESSRVTMDYEGNLYFANIIPDDAQNGKSYICAVTNNFIRTTVQGGDSQIEPQGTIAQARRNSPVLLYSSPTTIIKMRGETLRMKCIFGGYPTPTITWRRMRGSPRYQQSQHGHEIVIEDIQEADEGTYLCEGNNGVNPSAYREFQVTVEGKPYWIEKPTDTNIEEQETKIFRCEAGGKPIPNVMWFINGEKLEDIPASSRRSLINGGMALQFKSLQTADTCVVQCNVTNEHGYIFASAYLNVLAEAPIFLTEPPKYIKKVVDQKVNLTCRVFGAPIPQITWEKEGQLLSGGRHTVTADGDLVIEDLRLDDSGHYLCKARNTYGNIQASGELVVREKTVIDNPPTDQVVAIGEEAVLSCGATTDAAEEHKLRIYWLKDDQPINLNIDRRLTLSNDWSLVINPASRNDNARYTCVAGNGLDEDKREATLTVEAPPEPPTNVILNSCSTRSASISWTPGPPNNAPIQQYFIEYNNSRNPDQWLEIKTVNVPYTSAVVELFPYMTFNFRVKAANRIGTSQPSSHTSTLCRTPADVPARQPGNPEIQDYDSDSLYLVWDALDETELNGPGFHYLITYRRLDQPNAPEMTKKIDDFTKKEALIESETYVPYEITIEAVNEMGTARKPAEKIIGFSGEGVPNAIPQNFRLDHKYPPTDSTANFLWDAIDATHEAVQGFFVGYEMKWWPEDDPKDTSVVVVPINNPNNELRDLKNRRIGRQVLQYVSGTLEQLPPFTSVVAQVAVRNKKYTGEPSNSVIFRTDEGAPSAVQDFKVFRKGPVHLELSWELPAFPNGNILGYDIAYRNINNTRSRGDDVLDTTKTLSIDDPSQMKVKLLDLDPVTNYRVLLYARTGAGRGEEAVLEEMTLAMGFPERPDLVTVSGPTSMTVTWVPADENPGYGFYVEYKKPDETTWSKTPIETEKDYIVLTRLDPATEYEVRVVAVNGEGYETPSIMKAPRTAGTGTY
ncbi:neuroglian-like [Lingula anatina]|uniref:Neuroglian-like n=1 Tax=Lingula anatina TaxID=7574 RepID=A0A1S3H7G8_LINAN|nr:neuroglian-like [Lingula anatina]|eukprot:XP_013381922.1 neuroglian-like [Lingula anatina]